MVGYGTATVRIDLPVILSVFSCHRVSILNRKIDWIIPGKFKATYSCMYLR